MFTVPCTYLWASPLRTRAVCRYRSSSQGKVQAILNHKDSSITAVYDRYGMDPEKTEALAAWGRRVEEVTGGGHAGDGGSVPVPTLEGHCR